MSMIANVCSRQHTSRRTEQVGLLILSAPTIFLPLTLFSGSHGCTEPFTRVEHQVAWIYVVIRTEFTYGSTSTSPPPCRHSHVMKHSLPYIHCQTIPEALINCSRTIASCRFS
ncbi:hypothetical protein PoB_001099400 [Plakobranchus ocellatus]|uniref:Secreted protein n=1 Tax=Plakobranchus ocellatus TaxID=259542 RepID=A0AAV3YR84_9GAST|nr:hypothetical protein PoB_001099400 [Plakobranchus ocellatus]